MNTQKITQTDLNNLFKEVKEEVKDLVPYSNKIDDNIRISKRAFRFLGRCTKNWLKDSYFITVSKPLLNTNNIKLIKETLIHELIHTCKNCFNHGNNFKYFMYAVNNRTDYNITIGSNNKEYAEQVNKIKISRKPKYKITCVKCGTVTYRNRLQKNVTYTHAIDNGNLIIEELR